MGSVVGSITDAVGLTDIKGTQQRAEQAAAQQREAARQAGYAASFRPVGISTRFGTSQFTEEIDPVSGLPRVTSAGYTVDPQLRAIQDRLFGLTGGALSQAEQAQMAGQPLGQGATSLFNLASGFLPTDISRQASPEAMAQANRFYDLASQVTPTSYDPTAAAQNYYNEIQAMLDPSRQRQEQRLGAGVFSRGRAGLNISGQGQPELFALSQAREEQNAALAAQARERARAELQQDIGLGTQLGLSGLSTQEQAQSLARARLAEDIGLGTGLFGTAAQLLGSQYGLQSRALGPLQTYLGTAGTIEELGQQPFQLGMQVGGSGAQAGGAAGNLLGSGLSQAAATQRAGGDAASGQLTGFMNQMLGAALGSFGGFGGGGGFNNPWATQGPSRMIDRTGGWNNVGWGE